MTKARLCGALLLLACATAWAQSYLITNVAGGGMQPVPSAAVSAAFPAVVAVTTDTLGNVYFAAGDSVYMFDPAGTLTRAAGSGSAGYSGDGGAATAAQLAKPMGLAVDPAGNLYIADTNNSVVRKVATTGIITTVAGTGSAGYSGDGGRAATAELNRPRGVAVDAAGILYIADTESCVIRQVATDGTISTIAGNNTCGQSGDGGPATIAELSRPWGLALDSAGNLYSANGGSNTVRKVTPAGIITTVAGNGTSGFSGDSGQAVNAQLSSPQGVAVDTTGNLYIADYDNERIRKVATNGTISTVAGNGTTGSSGDGGSATSATFNGAYSVAVDGASNPYIADWLNYRIRKVAHGTITTAAGSGAITGPSVDGSLAANARLTSTDGVVADAQGNFYVSEGSSSRVRKVALDGTLTTVAGTGVYGNSGDGGPATSAKVSPGPLVVGADGSLYIGDLGFGVVRKVLQGTISTLATGFLPAEDLAIHAGNVYVADRGYNVIRMVAPNGAVTTVAGNFTQGYSGDGGQATGAQLNGPWLSRRTPPASCTSPTRRTT